MIKLLTVSDMRESDKNTIENGTDSKILMYRAGEAIFDLIKDYKPPFAIVCGNGNNAGDGYVLATFLKKVGIECTIFRTSERFSNDGLYYYEQCVQMGIDDQIIISNNPTDDTKAYIDCLIGVLGQYNTIVDCIFGTGFHGNVSEPVRSIIEAINHSTANTVVSVDINSGLNGDNGQCDICVHSDLTISIGNMKPGHLLNNAKDVCKKVINCDIGITPIVNCQEIYLCENSDFKEIFSDRLNNSNKGTYGYIGLIGGSQCFGGAIRLANMAACSMRSGAGVVKVAAPSSLGNVIMPQILESTFYPLSDNDANLIFDENEFNKLLNLSAIAFGMGIGNTEETKKALEYLLVNYTGTLIIDADGINALSQMDNILLDNASCQIIITPHPKEFSRLTGLNVADILCKPIELSKEYAAQHKIIVLIKGSSTVISDGNVSYITNRGCAGMATAGSGDVLSGILAAVCGYNKDTPLLATAAAAHIAGIAGELAGENYGMISMIASDTAKLLPKAIQTIQNY